MQKQPCLHNSHVDAREKIFKYIVYSACDCFTHSFVNFFVVTEMKIIRHMSFVCARIRIIWCMLVLFLLTLSASGFVCSYLCLLQCLLSAVYQFAHRTSFICFVVYCVTCNSAYTEQFYI